MDTGIEHRPIKGYENYEIYSDGRVFNKNTGKVKQIYVSKRGYYSIGLQLEGKTKTKTLHVLLAEAFIDNPNNYKIVDHIDRDKLNNNINNLRWTTSSENNRNRNPRNDVCVLGITKNYLKNGEFRWYRSDIRYNGIKYHRRFEPTIDGLIEAVVFRLLILTEID